jgi:hypothetical protein
MENQSDEHIDKKLQEYAQDTQLAIFWRGRVIESVVSLELAMNLYTAQFFCGNNDAKVNALITHILGDDRISFRGKLDAFTEVAKKYDSDWYNGYKGSKSMRNDLLEIMEVRNIFAHRLMDRESFSDVHATPGTLRFLIFKNDINSRDFTVQECEAFIKKINTIADYIHDRVLKPTTDSANVNSSDHQQGLE